MALRQVGRCRVNSSPAMDSLFTEPEGVAGFHPPLPPPPPPYHPPATPSHAQLKGAWRPRVPMPTPTRSFSYPCNRTLSQRHAATKHGGSEYSSVPRPQPPDCTNPQAMGRALLSDQQAVSYFQVSRGSVLFFPGKTSWFVPGSHLTSPTALFPPQMSMEPVVREFMPDIALGVSVMSLREQHMAEIEREGPHSPMGPSSHHLPHSSCHSVRLSHAHGPGHGHSCKRHAPEPKLEAQAEFPDLYDFSCRPATPTSTHPLPSFAGPDLYSHSCNPSGSYPPPYLSDSQSQALLQGRAGPDALRLDVLSMTSQRHDGVLASPSGAQPRLGHAQRGRSNETDLTHGLGHLRSPSGNADSYEERHTGSRDAPEEMVIGDSLGVAPHQQPHRNSVSDEVVRDRRSPSKLDYPYKKSAL